MLPVGFVLDIAMVAGDNEQPVRVIPGVDEAAHGRVNQPILRHKTPGREQPVHTGGLTDQIDGTIMANCNQTEWRCPDGTDNNSRSINLLRQRTTEWIGWG